MTPFSELTGRARVIEILRWFCVLPAAVLGAFVAQFLLGAVVHVVSSGGWGSLGDSNIAYTLRLFLFYVPHNALFVIAGAKMAPRRQLGTAIVLAILGILFSLLTHVVGQLLRGGLVGTTNYAHFLAESAGALGGAGYILLQVRGKLRQDGPQMNADERE